MQVRPREPKMLLIPEDKCFTSTKPSCSSSRRSVPSSLCFSGIFNGPSPTENSARAPPPIARSRTGSALPSLLTDWSRSALALAMDRGRHQDFSAGDVQISSSGRPSLEFGSFSDSVVTLANIASSNAPQPASTASVVSAPRRPSWLSLIRRRTSATMSGLQEEVQEDEHAAERLDAGPAQLSHNHSEDSTARTKHGTGDNKRLSFSSLLSFGSTIYGAREPPPRPPSTSSSVRSVPLPESNLQGANSASQLEHDANGDLVQAASLPDSSFMQTPTPRPARPSVSAADQGEWAKLGNTALPRRSRSRTQRRQSHSTATSSTSPNRSDRSHSKAANKSLGTVGICALDTKARSKPSRNILTRLQANGEFEIKVFGDKVILDEEVENWPLCDYLISFFSDGFPLDKAIKYANLRQPFCVNDLPMQKVLWDRRLCLKILDNLGVPTPDRVEVNRDGGPQLDDVELAEHVRYFSGVQLEGSANGTGGGCPAPKQVELIEDGDALLVDGVVLKKPFVEKPVSGEDHNVHIYFPKNHESGGGGRRLFRKIGNKSSEWDPDLIVPRCITQEDSSYIYEQFVDVINAEDVKAYTVGADFCHAETRRSPVVDGLVQRNTHGKEVRYITELSQTEQAMASKIAQGFGQRICGFDLLRADGKSYVIDVNGWSFVKDNNEYYDKCAKLLKQMFLAEKERFEFQHGYRSTATTEQNSPLVSRRPSNTHQHRQALKGLFKPPSLNRLRGSHGHNQPPKVKDDPSTSPDASALTTPVSSSPNFDFRQSGAMISEPILDQTGSAAVLSPNPPRPPRSDMTAPENAPLPASKHDWKLKGMVAVVRHADRTPKQKFKFTFHSDPFVELLKGHQEEVLLKGPAALRSVLDAVKRAQAEGVEDPARLSLLETSLQRKGAWSGTKVQIKPMFRKRKPSEMLDGEVPTAQQSPTIAAVSTDDTDLIQAIRSSSVTDVTMSRFTAGEEDLVLDKLQLVIKWGGEPTHAARYQSQDLGENMRKDLLLLNKDILGDVRVFSSSEKRVMTSAQIWASAFLDKEQIPEDFISIRKDLLDDSNAAKDVMDKVKKKLKGLLRQGIQPPPQFTWPPNTPEPYLVVRRVAELMRFHRKVMRNNMAKLKPRVNENGETEPAIDSSTIQARWCCGEDPELFKERWEKLFSEFVDSDKTDPSKVSELYDTMKFDALHNRQFLEWVFTPGPAMLQEMLKSKGEAEAGDEASTKDEEKLRELPEPVKKAVVSAVISASDKHIGNAIADKLGLKKKQPLPVVPGAFDTESKVIQSESYFKLYAGTGQTRAKQDERLENLRELYKLAKILYDFICPQEYGIEDSEKLEIGLLTSLPLLKEIVQDLEEVQASEDAKSFVYFTKESHVYTLLNAMLEGGLQTKIERNAIPELDYLSQIVFELYESEDRDAEEFTYSIRITISPGCHTQDPLDLLLDSKHSISCAPRRTLTPHCDWKDVIETLRAKFHTVRLPKSFIAVNLSERHARDNEKRTKVSGLKEEQGDAPEKAGETEAKAGRAEEVEAV